MMERNVGAAGVVRGSAVRAWALERRIILCNGSRFATVHEIESLPFDRISLELETIHHRYNLPDHGSVNRARYPWSKGMQAPPEIYAARLWEYPFAILEGEPEGKTCADIGCGMSAFTLYLHACGTVTGVDPDLFTQGVKASLRKLAR